MYINEKKLPRFQPIADSMKEYFPVIKFFASSILSALIDIIMLVLIHTLTSNLLSSVLLARFGSSLFNYAVNRKFIFAKGREKAAIQTSLPKYYALVLLILVMNYGLMHAFYERIGIPLIIAKLLTEASLFLLSYWSQRKFVYK